VLAALAAAVLDEPLPPLTGKLAVSDGDSFRFGEQRVRLLGLDAPELGQSCSNDDGMWACGRQARDRLSQLLLDPALSCEPEDVDQYDRLLATCSGSAGDLGAVMVSEGLAVSSGAYWQQEIAARNARLGIWSGDFDQPRQWRNDHAHPWGILSWLGL
jgi:endonuclease YncB( thermonuclease family)